MLQNMNIEFVYQKDGVRRQVFFEKDYKNQDFQAKVEWKEKEDKEYLNVTIIPAGEMIIEKLQAEKDFSFDGEDRLFLNGYQSWTDSREKGCEDRMKKIPLYTLPIIHKYRLKQYGDYIFRKYSGKKGELHGYTYSYIRRKDKEKAGGNYQLFGSLTERQGFTVFEFFTRENSIRISKECSGLKIDRPYEAFQLFYKSGSEKEVFDGYFEAMGIARPRVEKSTGWTSWYNYYQNISQDIILENLEYMEKEKSHIQMVQIDDGYQTAVGDWLSTDPVKFPKGMKYMADQIRKSGFRTGIWLAPFVCETNSKIYREKPDWLLRDQKGRPVPAGCNWSGFYALDFYHPEVREYIRTVFNTILDDWGYDMVKLDFLYAVCMQPGEGRTRGQIMTEAMEFLRDCVGDKLILGCGVPLGPAFGLVDYCRIGCDISLDWDDKFYMKVLLRERISTKNAIGNAIGRRHLDERAFLNDPDVFLLREDNIRLNTHQKETLAVVNHLFGSLLFTSDNLKLYGKEQFDLFHKVMEDRESQILQVEYPQGPGTGRVEVIYQEEGKNYLLILNLSAKEAAFLNRETGMQEIIPPYGHQIIQIS